MKKFAQTIAIILGSLVISLVLLEIGIRIFAPQPKYYAPKDLFTEDAVLGYKLTPDFNGIYSTPENKVKIKINSEGLRDYEHKERGDYRILGLGDSFIMGVGVELEETLLAILEKLLNSNITGQQFEIIKAGVQGYGTDQELAYFKTSGVTYKPDLIILGFYPNDIIDNLLPNFTVQDGYLTMKAADKRIKRKFFDYNFIAGIIKNELHLARFVISRVKNNPSFRKFFLESVDKLKKTRTERIAIYSKKPDKRLEEGWETTKALLKEMHEKAMEHNAKLLIVYIPERLQVYQKQWERIKKQWEIDENEFDIEFPNTLLAEFCRKQNIPFLDLQPTLKKYTNKGQKLYYDLDPHLTVKGNEVAAERIFQKIYQDNLFTTTHFNWDEQK